MLNPEILNPDNSGGLILKTEILFNLTA